MSGWRERVQELREGRDVWDNRDNSPENGPNVPIVPIVLGPKEQLAAWCDAVQPLDARKPHPGFDPQRWRNLVDASFWWIEHFGRQAALDGWQTGDVFGVIEGHPGAGGLIDRIGTSRSLVMDGKRARWRSFGVLMKFNAGTYSQLPAFWEVSPCE